jgi:hypothetical protein
LGRAWKGRKNGEGREAVGRAERERRKSWLGWAARKKRRGKRKRIVGRAQQGIEREKEMLSNAFEFEFKI